MASTQLDLYDDTPNDGYVPRVARDPFAFVPCPVPAPKAVVEAPKKKQATRKPEAGYVPQVVHLPGVADIADSGDWLFADGGLLGANGTTTIGTWAWVRVRDGKEIARDSGLLFAEGSGLQIVTNNNTELLALLNGAYRLLDTWHGTIASDSSVALGWLTKELVSYAAIPPMFFNHNGSLPKMRKRAYGLPFLCLAGHPKPEDLVAGKRISKAPHLPVSKWNVLTDELCTQAGIDYVAGQKI